MDAPGWLSQYQADVPSGVAWLSEGECRVLEGLRLQRRRADWRLGRWTAKLAVGAWLGLPPPRCEIVAAHDGAPEAWLGRRRQPVSVSLSHRGGRALAVVTDAPRFVGCDLELIEPRSDAFIREWLAPAEQRLISSCDARQRALLANLFWTAKEAAAKARREGLRLDVRRAVVTVGDTLAELGPWRPLWIDWDGEPDTTRAWWRAEPGWVMAIAGEPALGMPRELSAGSIGPTVTAGGGD